MLRVLAKAISRVGRPAFRRAVALAVAFCLVAGPVAGAFAAHHMDDLDNAVLMKADSSIEAASLSSDAKDVLASGKAHHPAKTGAVADHDCHGCSAAMVAAPASARAVPVKAVRQMLRASFGVGRIVPAEDRPPRA